MRYHTVEGGLCTVVPNIRGKVETESGTDRRNQANYEIETDTDTGKNMRHRTVIGEKKIEG